jgi:hypothetical protein
MRSNREGLIGCGKRAKLLDAAEADSIRLTQSSIDGTSFSDAHFSAANQRGYVRRVGVAVANESLRTWRFIHNGLEDPTAGQRIAKLTNRPNSDGRTRRTFGQSQEPSMSDIPALIDVMNVS